MQYGHQRFGKEIEANAISIGNMDAAPTQRDRSHLPSRAAPVTSSRGCGMQPDYLYATARIVTILVIVFHTENPGWTKIRTVEEDIITHAN